MAAPAERARLRSAKAFAAGLHPPMSPSICPVCFVFFVKEIEPNAAITKLLQIKGHEFWNAMMAFVALDWTRERQDAVSRLLGRQHSRCTKCKHAGHFGSLQQAVPDADTWFGLVFQVSCSCLHAGSVNRMARRGAFRGKHGRWPTSPEDLFPYGPELTIDALVSQIGTFSFVQAVLIDLVALQRSITFPLLLKAVHRSRIIASVIRRFTTCNTAINADLSECRQPVAESTQCDIALRHIRPCEATILMLHAIAFGPGSQPNDKREYFIFDVRELFRTFHPLVCLLYKDERYSWTATLASHFWVWLSDSERVAVGCPNPPFYGCEIDSSECLSDPYWALRYFLSLRPTRDRCNGPECGKLVRDKTASDTFSLCGKCRVMLYCSKECQTADWKRTPFPHRQVCDMLQELYTFASLDPSMSWEAFTDGCRAHAFPLQRVDYLITWATDGKTKSDYAGGMQIFIKPRNFEPQVKLLEVVSSDSGQRGAFYEVRVPPTADGQVMSQEELHAAMHKVKEELAVDGLDITWGFI